MSLIVADAMVRDLVTIESMQSGIDAAEKMCQHSVSSLLVFSENNLVGIVTMRDIVQKLVVKGIQPEKARVVDIMNTPVIVVNSEMPLTKAANIMIKEKIKKLPVIYPDSNKTRLVGLLTLTDIARLHPGIYEGVRRTEIDQTFHHEAINMIV